VINQRFVVHRGLALGLALMGTGLFGFFSKALTHWLINHFGWRGAYVGLGALPLLVALPVGYLCFTEVAAEAAGGLGNAPAAPAALPGLSEREAFLHWRFWLLGLALLVVSFAIAGPIPNVENILRVHGFSPAGITALASLIGLSAMAGRLLGGWLLDLFWAPAVACFILSLPAISCLLLSQAALSQAGATISICLIGFSVGVEYDLMAYLVARYFGMRGYATIYGTIYVFFGLGAGFGPFLFGWSYGVEGSYAPVLRVAFVVLLASALSLLALGRYPDFTKSAAAE
jgi:predicted MFS family arabinose efflux permease